MNKIGTWIAGIAIFVGAVNIVLFAVWWNMIEVTVEMPKSERGYTIEALALNITILEIVLALVGVVLAVIGLFGYGGIKSAAIAKATEVAKREANAVAGDQMRQFFRQEQAHQEQRGRAESAGLYQSPNVTLSMPEPAQETE